MNSAAAGLPVTRTEAGVVSGTVVNTPHGDVNAFLGIPYGLLDPGRGRFEPARSPVPWLGVRDCSRPGPAVPQNPDPYRQAGLPARQHDEVNGLNLNIWTPATESARRPVVVWIHGGANISGSNFDGLQNGARLASLADVVVVSVNYRLGVFGFLWLTEAQHGYSIGNAAMHDLICGLKWVRREIHRFGGDPDNVSVAGQSAGAALVGTLLGIPTAAGLFQRAIMQSGTAERVDLPADGARVAREILDHLGLDDTEGARIFQRSTTDILAAQAKVVSARQATDVGVSIVFRSVIDGELIPDVPLTSVRAGVSDAVDLLIGTNLDEASLFLAFDSPGTSPAAYAQTLEQEIGRDLGPDTSVDAYRSALRADLGRRPSDRECLQAYLTDRSYRQPSNRLLEARAGSSGRTYSYLFTWPSPSMHGRLGACHGVEMPFVFGTLALPEAGFFVGAEAPRALSDRMMSAWGAFVRHGRPDSDVAWPPYDPPKRTTRIWNEPSTSHDDPLAALRTFWAAATSPRIRSRAVTGP